MRNKMKRFAQVTTLLFLILFFEISAQHSERLNGAWSVNWTDNNSTSFAGTLVMNSTGGSKFEAVLVWQLKATKPGKFQQYIDRIAVEFLEGTLTGDEIQMSGYKEEDPLGIIALDSYKLSLSGDGRTIEGKTSNGGKWNGIFTAYLLK